EQDPETEVAGWAAAGITRAAALLSQTYTLVATNVPYLGRGSQNPTLANYCARHHADAKADLATCFLDRCGTATSADGVYALVLPQNWLTLGTYSRLRGRLIRSQTWAFLA